MATHLLAPGRQERLAIQENGKVRAEMLLAQSVIMLEVAPLIRLTRATCTLKTPAKKRRGFPIVSQASKMD